MADRAILRWAETGDRDDPGLAQELGGYQPLQTPPAEEFNYLMRQMSIRPPGYSSLSEAYESVADSTTVMVDEYDPSVAPLTKTWSYVNASMTAGQCVATDGLFVYLGDDANDTVFCLDRETGAVIDTLSLDAPIAISADGAFVFIALSGAAPKVVCYAQPTRVAGWGAQVWASPSLGAAPTDVYSNGQHVFVTQVAATGVTARRLNRSNGTFDWSSTAHGALLRAVKATATRVYVAGATDGGTFVRRLDYATGASAATATGLETYSLALVSVPSTETGGSSDAKRIALVAAGVDDGAQDVVAYTKDLVSVWAARIFATGEIHAVCWDGRRLYVAGNRLTNQSLASLDPVTGVLLQRFDHGSGIDLQDAATDGFGLFVCGDKDGANAIAWRHHILVKPDWATRLTGDEAHRFPYHIGMVKAGIEADYVES